MLDVIDDAYISGQTARNYLNTIDLQYRLDLQYRQPIEEREASVGDQHGPGFIGGERKSYIRLIWGEFLAHVMGNRGPFQKEGPRSRTKEAVGVCMEL